MTPDLPGTGSSVGSSVDDSLGGTDDRDSDRDGTGPLAGLRVLVPRATSGPDPLVIALRAVGADPVTVPLIQTVPPEDPTELDDVLLALGIGYYGWIVLTSGAAVPVLVDRAEETGTALPELLAGTLVAAVGPSTARALNDAGVQVDLLPPGSSSVADLLVAWPPVPPVTAPRHAVDRSSSTVPDPGSSPDDDARADAESASTRVLLPHADLATPSLGLGLRARGWTVDEVVAYRTVPGPAPDASTVEDWARGRLGAVVLTSGSTARHLLEMLGAVPSTTLVACLGPATAAVATALGIRVDAVATTQTPAALVAALAEAAVRTRDGALAGPAGTPTLLVPHPDPTNPTNPEVIP